MDDYISRQAAIDVLERQAKEMSRWAERYTEQAKGVLTAKNVIEDLPSAQPQTSMLTVECKLDDEELAKAIEEVKKANLELIAAEPHWIPCEDHPPLFDFTDVLLLYHDKRCGCENDYYIVQAYTVRGQWRPTLRIEDSDMESMEPVAWMPLPEPYKEGKKDG